MVVRIIASIVGLIFLGLAIWQSNEHLIPPVPKPVVPATETPSPAPHQRILRAPINITMYFSPSGFMGDGERGLQNLQINTAYRGSHDPDDTDGHCIRIAYQPGSKGFAGIYWLHPDSNFGDQPGSRIEGAQRIVFWARGENGGEIVEFKAGGNMAPNRRYQDSFEVSIGPISLTRDWERYEIDLSGQNLSNVLGAFAWIATKAANPDGLTFYLDNIRYE